MSNKKKKAVSSAVSAIVMWIFAQIGIVYHFGNYRIVGRKWYEFNFCYMPISGIYFIGIGWFVLEFANAAKFKRFAESLKHVTGRVSYLPFSEENIRKAT